MSPIGRIGPLTTSRRLAVIVGTLDNGYLRAFILNGTGLLGDKPLRDYTHGAVRDEGNPLSALDTAVIPELERLAHDAQLAVSEFLALARSL